ncbi:MAG: TetR/AcrR family transcriptional regulator [Candidatus Delongbacteria bacterium]|nr:TetR/AcrR family transcriptional regulator [Candidatus Delongbacteria bacterium]
MFCSKIKLKEIEMKKKAILDEAKKIINKVGFKNAKMKDIAEKVGFSKASLYSYFKDKDEIAMNIFKEHLLKMFNKIKDLPEQKMTALEKFNEIKKLQIGFIKDGKNLMTIKPNLKELTKVHLEVFELRNKLFTVLKTIIEQGKKEKVYNTNIDVDQSIIILDSLITGIIFNASMRKNIKNDLIKTYDIEEMIGKAIDFFILGITNTKTELK